MKILLVATVQSHICQFHRPLVEMLHAHGCKVDVAARNNLAEKDGLKLDFVENVFDVPFSRSPIDVRNVTAYKHLKAIIERGEYAIIHCNTPVGGVLTRLAAISARKRGTKVFYTAHGFHFYRGAPLKNWLIFYPIEKMMSRLTDVLITIVFEDYGFAKKRFGCQVYHIHGVGVDGKRFCVVSEAKQRQLRMQMGYSSEERILLCVGELLSNKNQKMAIEMMPYILSQYPNTRLLIAGNGPEKEALQRLVDSLGLQKHIEFLGYRRDIDQYYKISDLLVACSIREGLGMNVLEAMMCGKPVVATVNRGHRELVGESNGGILVPVGNTTKMAEGIISMFAEPETYQQCAKNAMVFANKYEIQRVMEELEGIYGL